MVAVTSAVLLWAAFYPGLHWLAWFGLAGALWAVAGQGVKRGMLTGALVGFVFFLLGFSFLLELWPFVGPLTAPLWLLLALYASLYVAVLGGVGGRWASPPILAGAWVLLEAARGAGPFGTTFSSLPGALAASPFVRVVGLGGPWILSLAVAWTAACLAVGVRRRRWLPMALLGPMIVLAGLWFPEATQDVGTLKAALVQTGVPQEERLDPGSVPQLMERYEALLAKLDGPLDLVVFPESVLPVPLRTQSAYLVPFQQAARRLDADLLVGAGEWRDGKMYNSTLLLNGEGDVIGVYDKQRLVPFGEYLPARRLWEALGLGPLLERLLPMDVAHGALGAPVGRYGVKICFESQFPSGIRRLVAEQAELLVVPTNDAWFGEARLLWEHFIFGALRAAEQGRAFVHATSTGVTGAFGPSGELLATLPQGDRGVLYVELPLRRGSTPYGIVGDGPVLGIAALLLLGGLFGQFRRTRASPPR